LDVTVIKWTVQSFFYFFFELIKIRVLKPNRRSNTLKLGVVAGMEGFEFS